MERYALLIRTVVPLTVGREFGVVHRLHAITVVCRLFCRISGFQWIDTDKAVYEPVQFLENPRGERPVGGDEDEMLVVAVAADHCVSQQEAGHEVVLRASEFGPETRS